MDRRGLGGGAMDPSLPIADAGLCAAPLAAPFRDLQGENDFGDGSNEPSHADYVCLRNIELDHDPNFDVAAFDAEQFRSLFDCEYGTAIQEYEGLTSLWSPPDVSADQDAAELHVHGAFQDFELWMQESVIPREEILENSRFSLQTSTLQPAPSRVSCQLTERQRRPQVVRNWLSDHASWPYPTTAQKEILITATGYTERQLDVCLSNLRARNKNSLHGHINVTNSGSTTRCDTVPADRNHIQPGSMIASQASILPDISSPSEPETSDSSSWLVSPDASCHTPDNTTALTLFHQVLEPNQAHQTSQGVSAARTATMPKRKGRRHRAETYQAGAGEHLPHATTIHTTSAGPEKSGHRFVCTVFGCIRSFENASGWKRHEAGFHGHTDHKWICMLTEAFKSRSECVFCLEPMDSIDHLSSHTIARCSEKCTIERSFFRKDFLKQHVLHAHLAGEPDAVRRNFKVPQEWCKEVESSAVPPGSRWCGFCRCAFETTAKRMDHVAQHFRKGQDMTNWIRM